MLEAHDGFLAYHLRPHSAFPGWLPPVWCYFALKSHIYQTVQFTEWYFVYHLIVSSFVYPQVYQHLYILQKWPIKCEAHIRVCLRATQQYHNSVKKEWVPSHQGMTWPITQVTWAPQQDIGRGMHILGATQYTYQNSPIKISFHGLSGNSDEVGLEDC